MLTMTKIIFGWRFHFEAGHTLQDICSLRAQKEDEKVELLNLEKEKAALAELLATVRRQKEKEQVTTGH